MCCKVVEWLVDFTVARMVVVDVIGDGCNGLKKGNLCCTQVWSKAAMNIVAYGQWPKHRFVRKDFMERALGRTRYHANFSKDI